MYVYAFVHINDFSNSGFIVYEMNVYIIQWFMVQKDKKYSFLSDYEVSKLWMRRVMINQFCDTVMFQIFYGSVLKCVYKVGTSQM